MQTFPATELIRLDVAQPSMPLGAFPKNNLRQADLEVPCAAAEMLCQPVGVAAGNPAGIAMIQP